MLTKVISGGQVGVDIAALRAASSCGITTGGYAPKNWMTLKGSREGELRAYGLIEMAEKGYPPRTEANVRHSDCTIRIAVDFKTPGEACTLRYLKKYGQRYKDVVVTVRQYEKDVHFFEKYQEVAQWIIRNNFDVINVAGNAKSWLEPHVERYLRAVFLNVIDYRDAPVPDE